MSDKRDLIKPISAKTMGLAAKGMMIEVRKIEALVRKMGGET